MTVSHKKEPMEFHRLTLKSGLNMTVRRYNRWLGSTGVYQAVDHEGRAAKIRIIETISMVFRSLIDGAVFLVLHNDPNARVYSQLNTRMKGWYPGRPNFADEPAFHQDDEVTVVFFTVLDKGNSIAQE